MRLDQYLVREGFFESRARAQGAVKAGCVRVNGVVTRKSALTIGEDDAVSVVGDVHPYVSRGGVKLDAALDAMDIDPAGKTCLDLGASTGGFCDVLLARGAAKIYAVDVGAGQLHKKIAGDARVVNLEKTHAKDLSRTLVADLINLIVCDVSFISLKKALPPALALAGPAREGVQLTSRRHSRPGARLIALVKPQFEVGPSNIGKGGVVKPGRENAEGVAEDLAQWLDTQPGWKATGWIESPIAGGDGNREFLLGGVRT